MERDPQFLTPETSDGPDALRHPLELVQPLLSNWPAYQDELQASRANAFLSVHQLLTGPTKSALQSNLTALETGLGHRESVQALSLKLDAGLATGLLTESDSRVGQLRNAISAEELSADIQWSIHNATETPRSVSAIDAVRTLAAAARRELLPPETIAGLLGQIQETKFQASLSQSLVVAAQRGQQGDDGRGALTAVDGLAASLYLEKRYGDVLTAQDATTILSLLNEEPTRALLWREIGTLLAQGTTTAELRRQYGQPALGDTSEARQGCAGVAAVQYLATLSERTH